MYVYVCVCMCACACVCKYFDYCFRLVGGRFVFKCDFEYSILTLKAPQFHLEVVKAWEDIENCRNYENEALNRIMFNNGNIRVRGKTVFYWDIFDLGICRVTDIIENGRVKSVDYFQSLGITGEGLLRLNDIITAIPMSWKENSAQDRFQQIDLANFDIVLNIFEQKINFKYLKSRQMYVYFNRE